MKKLSLKLIKLYQKIPGPWHNSCRYYPTCSQYAYIAIEKYGFLIGWRLAIKRILRCAPWGLSGYDPVPNLSNKKEH